MNVGDRESGRWRRPNPLEDSRYRCPTSIENPRVTEEHELIVGEVETSFDLEGELFPVDVAGELPAPLRLPDQFGGAAVVPRFRGRSLTTQLAQGGISRRSGVLFPVQDRQQGRRRSGPAWTSGRCAVRAS